MKISLEDFDVEHEPPRYVTADELEVILENERRWSLFYDIETEPADDETLYSFFDESAVKVPEHPGEFDATKVKYGNTRDIKKKAEKLELEKSKHRQALASYDDDCRIAVDEAWNAFVKGSTLDPCLSRVLGIGYGVLVKGKEPLLLLDVGRDEKAMIEEFWRFVPHAKRRSGKIITFNGHFFDFPFLTARSWALDIPCPKLITKYNKYEDFCIDVALEYRQGRYGGAGAIKLDKLAQMFGVRRKLEGMTGDMFWSVYRENPEQALEYLELDVLVLHDCARRMNLC
jgi:hypothetical protein